MIVGLSAFFFLAANFLNFTTPRLFNSPDETTHFVFIDHFARTSKLALSQPYSYGQYSSFIFPRSTVAVQEEIRPVGFWGLNVMYGFLAKIIGSQSIVFVTPLLTLLAGACFFCIIKKIFSRLVAKWSTVLFFMQPAIWYYTARSLFPNLPFLFLLLLGLYLLYCRPFDSLTASYHLPAQNDFFGLTSILMALLIRPSEVWWIGIIFLFIFWQYRPSFTARRIFIGTILFALTLIVYVKVTKTLFPGELIGYTASHSFTINHWYQFIFPFGLELKTILLTTWQYGVKLLWWLTFPTLIGFFIFVKQWKQAGRPKIQTTYMFITLGVSLFLLLFYGSFFDPHFYLFSIGVAYSRYFLPLFVVSIPFLVLGLYGLTNFLPAKFQKFGFAWLIALIFLLNFRLVFLGDDGLFSVAENIRHGAFVRQWVTDNTPPASIILTDAEDKFFWPERQVMVNSFQPDILQAVIGLLTQGQSLYYFAPLPKLDESKDLASRFSAVGIDLKPSRYFPPHVLYSLSLLNSSTK